MYMKGSWVKLTIGLGKGKKLHDKRDDIKRRDDNRDIARAMKRDYD
jgi:SsrA-binding protein